MGVSRRIWTRWFVRQWDTHSEGKGHEKRNAGNPEQASNQGSAQRTIAKVIRRRLVHKR